MTNFEGGPPLFTDSLTADEAYELDEEDRRRAETLDELNDRDDR